MDQYVYNGVGFVHKLPTGIITLDIALGGGIPLDSAVIEIYGEESHGKSTLAYRICSACTNRTNNGYVTWIDSELSYDDYWAKVQHVNVNNMLVYRPPHMEASIDTILNDIKRYKEVYLPWLLDSRWRPTQEQAESAGVGVTNVEAVKAHMIETAPPHIIVWDSLAASPVRSVAESEGDFKEGMAYRARLIKSFLSRYQVNVEGCDKVCMILINQVIDNIGDMYGPAIVTPGGRGLRHGKHLAIYVKKAGSGEKDQENFTVTDYIKLAITKNKITPIISSFPVLFSKSRGYIGATSVLEYLMEIGWFRNAGSWKKFTYKTVDITTGEIKEEEISIQRGSFYKLIQDRPELFEYLCESIKDMFCSKFEGNKSLESVDIPSIIKACYEEAYDIPNEKEIESIEESY